MNTNEDSGSAVQRKLKVFVVDEAPSGAENGGVEGDVDVDVDEWIRKPVAQDLRLVSVIIHGRDCCANLTKIKRRNCS